MCGMPFAQLLAVLAVEGIYMYSPGLVSKTWSSNPALPVDTEIRARPCLGLLTKVAFSSLTCIPA